MTCMQKKIKPLSILKDKGFMLKKGGKKILPLLCNLHTYMIMKIILIVNSNLNFLVSVHFLVTFVAPMKCNRNDFFIVLMDNVVRSSLFISLLASTLPPHVKISYY